MLVGVAAILGSEVVLSPVVSGRVPSCGGWVLVGVVGFLGSEVVLCPVVSGCLPSCGGRVLVGVAASRTETFRDQNHRLQSKFVFCKLFGVYAGVIFSSFLQFWKLERNTTYNTAQQGTGENRHPYQTPFLLEFQLFVVLNF